MVTKPDPSGLAYPTSVLGFIGAVVTIVLLVTLKSNAMAWVMVFVGWIIFVAFLFITKRE